MIKRKSDDGANYVGSLGGVVVVRSYTSDGRPIDSYRLTPGQAHLMADTLRASAYRAQVHIAARAEEDRERFGGHKQTEFDVSGGPA